MSLNKVLVDVVQSLTASQRKRACGNIRAFYDCGSQSVAYLNELTSQTANIGNVYKLTTEGILTSFNSNLEVKENTVVYLTENGWVKFGGTGDGSGGAEYQAGDNIDIQGYIISVTGTKNIVIQYPLTAYEDDSGNIIISAKNCLYPYGNLVDSDVVQVTNNSHHKLSTTRANLTLNLPLSEVNEVPSFDIEIEPSVDCTLTITTTFEGTTKTLYYNDSLGNVLEAGGYYQVTCVGNCWLFSKFVNPNS